jgi:hypothetical protein
MEIAYDYGVGFAVFYLLSITHVMLEFPLNHRTITGICAAVLGRGGMPSLRTD